MARRGSAIEVEITEGAIRVRSHGRVLTIANAPLPADFNEEADFLVRLDDIENWDPPHEDASIEIAELQRILEAIEQQAEKHGLIVAFE